MPTLLMWWKCVPSHVHVLVSSRPVLSRPKLFDAKYPSIDSCIGVVNLTLCNGLTPHSCVYNTNFGRLLATTRCARGSRKKCG